MGHMFPTLLCRIVWHYASETDEAYDDCCFDGFFLCVECGRSTFDFYRYFWFVINYKSGGNFYKPKEQTGFPRHF